MCAQIWKVVFSWPVFFKKTEMFNWTLSRACISVMAKVKTWKIKLFYQFPKRIFSTIWSFGFVDISFNFRTSTTKILKLFYNQSRKAICQFFFLYSRATLRFQQFVIFFTSLERAFFQLNGVWSSLQLTFQLMHRKHLTPLHVIKLASCVIAVAC